MFMDSSRYGLGLGLRETRSRPDRRGSPGHIVKVGAVLTTAALRLTAVAATARQPTAALPPSSSILIRGGGLVDGTGAPARTADLRVGHDRGDRAASVSARR